MIHVLFLLLMYNSCIITPKKDEAPHQKVSALRLKEHAQAIKQFAHSQKASQQLAILVDMSIASNKKRIFLVDLNTDSVLVSGLCAHGQGVDYTKEEVVFSNVVGSNCTAIGHYRVGGKYTGEYGQAYKLFGLDSSNSNAFKRFIVFHYYPCVSDFEDATVCRSNGCPMVNTWMLQINRFCCGSISEGASFMIRNASPCHRFARHPSPSASG